MHRSHWQIFAITSRGGASRWRSITTDYRVYTCPPPLTGGVTVLATLRALDGVAALDATTGRDPKYIDLVGRVLLAVYPRVDRTIADVPSAVGERTKLFAKESVRTIQKEAAAVDPADADAEPVQTGAAGGDRR